jgi:hypothetical protein
MDATGVPPGTSEMVDTGDPQGPMPGALIYEYRPQITKIVEYGASADAVLRVRHHHPRGRGSTSISRGR